MTFDLSHLGFGIFIVLLVGVVVWFARMTARSSHAREQDAINRTFYHQPWDVDKSNRSGNR